MPAGSIRARVRAEMIAEIKAVARRHLETDGANLSLRAVARDMGMVSSALYRYFASRDDLLTALILDAYNALGEAAEAADAAVTGRSQLRARWLATARGIRGWALRTPAEYALLFGTIYALSSGTSHSAQCALAAMLKAVNGGEVDFVAILREYGEKAKIMKRLFVENGFRIVYDKDLDQPVADGFYFTFAYPGMQGGELLGELLPYGISAITLDITGSERTEGLRACTSLIPRSQFPDLGARLKAFSQAHPVPVVTCG